MKMNKIVVSLLSAGVMASPFAHATNGDSMMSVGSQNTALGGSGVANFVGADSTFANPAMLAKSKGQEVTGSIVLFMPKVTNTGMPGGTAADSSANTNYIPDISYSSRIDDNLTYGIAMAGIAGMGVDYSGAPLNTHVKAKSALSILRVVPTIAYNDTDYGVGFSPVLQYGSLMLSYNSYNAAEKADADTGYGYSLGGYFNATPEVTIAASYQSEIAAKYGTQISGAGKGFNPPAAFGDDLTQPAEIKVGVAYSMSNITMTADYKQIQWGSAAGYKDFNWKNQTVVAVGGKYAADGYWLGLGYNYADDPIVETSASAANGDLIDLFNNMFFPAIVKSSFTFGGGYDISKSLAVEGAAVITPKVTKTVAVAGFGGTNTTTHSQQSYSVSLRYKY